MKNLINIGLITLVVIAFASCQKTEFNSPALSSAKSEQPTYKTYHGDADEFDNGGFFTDKDKCKRCHTTSGKTMGVNWVPPYMSDNRYNSIEELVDNFDFVNNIHLQKGAIKVKQTISDEQRAELIAYLKTLEVISATK